MVWHVASNATLDNFKEESELRYVTDSFPANASNLYDYFNKEIQKGVHDGKIN